MTTLIICLTIVICVYIFFYFINILDKRNKETAEDITTMFDDIDNIKEIIDRTITIDIYNDSVKQNLLTINNILSKYYDDRTNSSTEESQCS